MTTGAGAPARRGDAASPGGRVRVALGLGSNVGDRLGELARAVDGLGEAVSREALSSVYESDAVGYEDQPAFLNAVVVGSTGLGPEALLELALELEERAGRRRTFRNAPRTLDVDLVLYDDLSLTREGLRIPHPRWRERAFVLAPLAEVAPDWTDPGTGRTVLDLWTERRGDLPPVRVVASPRALLRSGA